VGLGHLRSDAAVRTLGLRWLSGTVARTAACSPGAALRRDLLALLEAVLVWRCAHFAGIDHPAGAARHLRR
jgi:hypothetical protein